MNLVATLLAAALQASAAKGAATQKEFLCEGDMPETHYGHAEPQRDARVRHGAITVRIDPVARRYAIVQASPEFSVLCNVWSVCDGSERSIHEVKSNAYVLAELRSKDQAFERVVDLSLDRMKPAITYRALVDWQQLVGGVIVKATLACSVADVTPDKPLY